jgi:hypothetical protein
MDNPGYSLVLLTHQTTLLKDLNLPLWAIPLAANRSATDDIDNFI